MSIFAKYPGGQAIAAGTGGGGDVVGPGSSTTNSVAIFADTTGKLLESENLLFSSATLSLEVTPSGTSPDFIVSGSDNSDGGQPGGNLVLRPGIDQVGFNGDGTVYLQAGQGNNLNYSNILGTQTDRVALLHNVPLAFYQGDNVNSTLTSFLGFDSSKAFLALSSAAGSPGTGHDLFQMALSGSFTMAKATGAHLLWATAGGGNIGATASTSGPDYRPSMGYFSGSLIVGNLLGTSPPYGSNGLSGTVQVGNLLHTVAYIAATGALGGNLAAGSIGFIKDGAGNNIPGFWNIDNASDFDVYFGIGHLSASRTDLVKFGSNGNVSLLTANAKLISDGYVVSAGETVNGNSGASVTIDFSSQSAQEVKFTANCTVTFSNPHVGGAYVLRVVNDGTARTITWPGSVLWSGGTAPVLTGTNGKVDLINFYYDGTSYYGSFSLNY